LRAVLVNRARTFIFTTASPPPVAAAAAAALQLARAPDGDLRRSQLHDRIHQLRKGLALPAEGGPILPLILGADRAALETSAALRERGLFVQAIRPPTVPEGTARLRVTLSAAHTAADVDVLLAALQALRLR
jgi:8-amino-7-oxononanoate synthase